MNKEENTIDIIINVVSQNLTMIFDSVPQNIQEKLIEFKKMNYNFSITVLTKLVEKHFEDIMSHNDEKLLAHIKELAEENNFDTISIIKQMKKRKSTIYSNLKYLCLVILASKYFNCKTLPLYELDIVFEFIQKVDPAKHLLFLKLCRHYIEKSEINLVKMLKIKKMLLIKIDKMIEVNE